MSISRALLLTVGSMPTLGRPCGQRQQRRRSHALVRQHRGKRIGLVTPGTGRPSRQLMAHADFSRHVRAGGCAFTTPGPDPGTKHQEARAWVAERRGARRGGSTGR